MKMHMVFVALLALPAPLAEAQAAREPLKVYVVAAQAEARKDIDKETKKQLEAALDAAEKKRKDLEKDLKAQFGKKKEDWPQDKQDLYYDAEETEALAEADLEYRKVSPEGLSDSADDISKSLAGEGMAGKKDNVVVVQTPAEADLIVEVVGRRSAKTLGTQVRADKYWVSFLIKAGPKLTAERFMAVPRTYRFKRFGVGGWRLQTPKPEAPFWRFDAYGEQRWGNAANTASRIVEDFVTKNYASLTGNTN
jgi:hypothetical protein